MFYCSNGLFLFYFGFRGRAVLDLAGGSGLCSIAVTVFFSSTLIFTAIHWVATLNVGSGGAHASYYHRANEQVGLLTPSPTPNKSLQTPTGPAGLLFFLPTLCIHFMRAFILPVPCQSVLPARTRLVLTETDPSPILAPPFSGSGWSGV